jgi:hypothetical protein
VLKKCFRRRNGRKERNELSENPVLDFVRKIANSADEGSDQIQAQLTQENSYPKTVRKI